MPPRAFVVALALLLGAALWLAPSAARAWVEVHVGRDDLRVEVDRAGKARVEHRVLLLVSGGPLRAVTIRGVDADAELEPGAYIIPEKADKATALDAARPVDVTKKTVDEPPGTSRTDLDIRFDDAAPVSRGRFLLVLRYRTDLVAQGALRQDGAAAILRWVGPSWDDGLDTTRAVFALPLGPTEPRAFSPEDEESGGAPGSYLSNLERRADGDTLELVRLYAPQGERVPWTIRLDARAVGLGAAPAEHPARPLAPAVEPDAPIARLRPELMLLAGLALFLVLAAVIVAHGLEVKRRAAERRAAPRPLVPLPLAARAVLAATAFVAGLYLQLTQPSSLPGALAAAALAPLVWYRVATVKASPRPPGKWLPLSQREALEAPRAAPWGAFHLASRAGKASLLLMVALVAAATWLVAERSRHHALLVALDVVPLLSLFASGGPRWVPADLASDPIPLLREVARRIRRARPDARIVPRVRLPSGGVDADEIRLVVLPPGPAEGLRGVEIATGWVAGPGGWILLPEILVRVEDKSPAALAAYALEPFGARAPGRRITERVLALAPKLPTARQTAELAIAILDRMSVKRPAAATPAQKEPPARNLASLAA